MTGNKGRHDSQVSFEKLAETSPTAITEVNKQGDIVYANSKAEEVLGLKRTKITERSYDDPDWKITDLDGNDYPPEKLPFELVKETGEPVYDVRHAIEWPDEERKLLSVNASPLFDEDGNFDGMVAVIKDITDQVKAREELKQGRDRYHKYFEELGDAIFILAMGGEAHGRILEVNTTAVEQTGYSQEELVGMNMIEDLSLEPPPDMDYEEANEKLSRGEIVSFTEKKERKDGTEYWTEVVATPIDYEGRQANLSINRDITEKTRAQSRLEKQRREKSILIKNLPGMAYRCDNDREWTMRFVSNGCKELTGYEPEELIDNSLLSYGDLILEKDKEKVWKEVQKHLNNKQHFRLEYRIRTREGEVKWVWERGRGIFDEDGQLKNIQGIITDITKRKNM
ncbi:MAG: PAS domain S-box protein, partial [Candidatus Bipolaricaulia bacterium]